MRSCRAFKVGNLFHTINHIIPIDKNIRSLTFLHRGSLYKQCRPKSLCSQPTDTFFTKCSFFVGFNICSNFQKAIIQGGISHTASIIFDNQHR